MKILFIIPAFNIKNGGSICSKVFLDIFHEFFSDIMLMLPQSSTYAWDISEYNLLEVPETPLFMKYSKIISGVPHRFYPYIKHIWNKINRPDLVVFSSSWLAAGCGEFLKDQGIPFITIHHNYEYDFHKDNHSKQSLYGLNASLFRKIENFAYTNSMGNVFLTRSDADKIKGNSQDVPQDVPNVCIPGIIEKCNSLPQIRDKSPEIKNIVISGALCDKQTEDGITHYIKNLHKFVTDALPGATVIIAGRNPSKRLIKIANRYNNINLLPNPISLDTILSEADIFLNPTRLGSGIKLRMVDALKYGCPVLKT